MGMKLPREVQLLLMGAFTAGTIVFFSMAASRMTQPVSIFVVKADSLGSAVSDVSVSSDGSESTVSDALVSSTLEADDTSSVSPLGERSIDLNTATKEELEALSGIGETLAERILDYREQMNGFLDVEELLEVEGIGEKTFSRIEPFVYVSEK